MKSRLKWEKLLCPIRKKDTVEEKNEKLESPISIRNEFDRDYERLVCSSSVRRLQDKAQVFPLQRNDFTRTRLTHSIEVASLGRSLAWNVANRIAKEEKLSTEDKKSFDSIEKIRRLPCLVEVACFVHDLGNPPFGHYGEDVIKKWFEKKADEKHSGSLDTRMSEVEYSDFKRFDGNAQTIRILTRLQNSNEDYGANLTLATLAVLMKYPWSSSSEKAKDLQKFGYMVSEKEFVEDIEKYVGINGFRHPATFLVEAADDIAYLVADVEDGIKKKLLSWHKIEKKIFDNLLELEKDKVVSPEKVIMLKEKIGKAKQNDLPDIDVVRFQIYKTFIQGVFIDETVEAFMRNYESIMMGDFENELIKNARINTIQQLLKGIAREYCYPSDEVVKLELIGDKVISDMLDWFVEATLTVESDSNTCAKSREEKLVRLISNNFKFAQKQNNRVESHRRLSDYEKTQTIVDFISGMTDSYAVNLHRELSNVKM